MLSHQAPALGLSVGATNLAGVSGVHPAVVRPAEAVLPGRRLSGFVDRIGDPVPLIAPDGSTHRPEDLLADALHSVAQAATQGADVAEVAVAVPAHWPPSVVDAVRRTLQHRVVPDAAAALTALNAEPGLPRRGVIVLCDFGGSGTSVTLADADSDLRPIGATVRFEDFSGDLVDQALLRHVAASFADSDTDPSGTAMVGALTRLRAECRDAKERLSAETATTVAVDMPSHRAQVRVTRAELEGLLHGPLADFLAAVDDKLARHRIAPAAVSAVATIGGGARIPLITQLLSEHLRVPVVTTPLPALTAAHGAALIAQRSAMIDTATALAPATGADALTAVFDDGAPSSTFGALAWSQDDGSDADILFAAADTAHPQPSGSRPRLHFEQEQWQDSVPPRRTPAVLFGLAAAAAVITTAVFGVMLLSDDTATPIEAATTVAPSPAPAAPVNTPAPPAPQAPPVTTVVVQPAQRSNPAPRQQAPAPRPVAPPVAAPSTAAPPPSTPAPTTTPPNTAPTTPPPSTPPSTQPSTPPDAPPSSPEPPPIDPGPGNGEDPGAPPADPGDQLPAPPETDSES